MHTGTILFVFDMIRALPIKTKSFEKKMRRQVVFTP